MLDVYQPMQVLLALWPTAEFELPADSVEFGRRLTAQFPLFQGVQIVQVQGGLAPAEMPQLVLTGEGHKWGLELAPARVTLRRVMDEMGTFGWLLEQVRGTLLPLHTWLAENANLRVYRVGLVVDLMCNTRSSATEKIENYFIQTRALQGSPMAEIHLAMHHRLVLGGGVMANRWLRIQPMRTRDPRRLDFAAQVQVDLNTMSEDTQVKTGRDLAAFIEAAGEHVMEGIPMLNDPDFLA